MGCQAGLAEPRQDSYTPRIRYSAVIVHCRSHSLAGQRVPQVGRRLLRGSAILVVADANMKRYHISKWMTALEASRWAIREMPRLPLALLTDLREPLSALLGSCRPRGNEDCMRRHRCQGRRQHLFDPGHRMRLKPALRHAVLLPLAVVLITGR